GANSTAMALPRPVPAPVTRTGTPSKVPGGSAVVPGGGGSGSPGTSTPLVLGRAVLGPRGPQLSHVIGTRDEGLGDHLLVHGRDHLGDGEVVQDPARRTHRH